MSEARENEGAELGGLDAGELLARAMQTVQPTAGATNWEPPSLEELQALLPGYRLVSLLGRGGMGAVYRAIQVRLERPVAIKLLPAEMATDRGFVARFEREARTLARLHHPGIVGIHDFGQTETGHYYFIMEYVEGNNLRELLRAGRLDVPEVLAVVEQLCDALQAAHHEGIVHRDIKPENVLINREGFVKLADFGLSRPPREENAANLTQSNIVMGTPQYMAPEQQTSATQADHRSDIFALGVMLYEMLTGHTPSSVVDLPSHEVRVDVRLDEVVVKALQKQPERRYQAVNELKSDVERIRNTPSPEARTETPDPETPSPFFRSRLGMASGVVVLTVVLAGGGWQWMHRTKAGASISASPVEAGNDSATSAKEAPGASPKDLPATAATTAQPFVNSLGLSFVPIPRTHVLFGTTPVRVQDFRAFVEATHYDATGDGEVLIDGVVTGGLPKDKAGSWLHPGFAQEEDHPVVDVSWLDGVAFCEWLSNKEHRHYRLPTDREWSCALGIDEIEDPQATPEKRGMAKEDLYPWGKGWPPPPNIGNLPDRTIVEAYPTFGFDHLADYRDGYLTSSPVTAFRRNPFGLYDMIGNVQQWCEDWSNAKCEQRVIRSISFAYGRKDSLRSTHRSVDVPTHRKPSYGFRCVLVLDEAKEAKETPGGASAR